MKYYGAIGSAFVKLLENSSDLRVSKFVKS